MARVAVRAAERLRQFFDNNPHEWLSIEDTMAKFNIPRSTATHALAEFTKTGVAERVSVYRLRLVSDQVSAEVSK